MSSKHAIVVLACLLGFSPLQAATASLSVVFTNLGVPLDDPSEGRFYIYDVGKRETYLTWGNAARPARIEEGVYDVVIRYVNDTIVEERVLEAFSLNGTVVREEAFEIRPAYLTVEITAGGNPIQMHSGSYSVHASGQRGKPLASRRPGERVTLRPGRYDVEARYRDPRGLQSTWINDIQVVDDQVETVDIGVAPARLSVLIAYDGIPAAPGDGEWEIHRPGDPQALAGGMSGEGLDVPAGVYDLRVVLAVPGAEPLERWIRDLKVDGERQETIDLHEADHPLRVSVTHAGEPLPEAWFRVLATGQTADPVAGGRSGETVELPAGRYDVQCLYRKGAIRAEEWLRNREVDGPVELSVDMPFSIATLTVAPPRRIKDAAGGGSLLILLDSSAAMDEPMGDRSTAELLGQTLLDSVGALEGAETAVGLRVWGIAPRGMNNCRDSTLLLPPAPFDRTAIGHALELIRPSGFSALAQSLLEAADDLPSEGRSTVVVITRGGEECGGDPCDAAARLIKRGRADRIHIVALEQDQDPEGKLSCVGAYHGVSDRAELRSSLRTIFRDATRADRGRVTVFLPGLNRWVASAELDQPLPLLEGRYDLLIRAGSRSWHWNDVEVRGETRITAGPER